jgi:membrane fusion protein (multidrug efflux system)
MPKMPPTFVEAITVKPSSHQDQVSVTGSMIAIPGIIVKPEISGRITKIFFKSGDTVTAGTPLIEINSDLIKAQLMGARARSRLALTQFKRFTELRKTRAVSRTEFDKAQADYSSAQAEVDRIQAQLNQANIVAPFSGKLGLSQVSVGDYVNAGQSIVTLQTTDPLKVDFSIPEVYLSKVAVGQTVLLRTDAYPKEIFTGKVEAIESLINQNNRTLNVRANVPNKNAKLLPGAFVETTLQLSLQKSLIMIPQTAIVYAPEGNYVFKVVKGKAVKAAVILGERDSDNIVVKSGVKTNDVIIIAGQLKVIEGAPVVVTENKNPKA